MKTKSESRKLRIVLDANVFTAAYLSKSTTSPNKELINRWLNGEFTLLTSDVLLKEVANKLIEKNIDTLLIEELLTNISIYAKEIFISDEKFIEVIKEDIDDNHVIACAVVGKANYIITYDSHFDVLGGEYKGIRILEPLPFLFEFRKL